MGSSALGTVDGVVEEQREEAKQSADRLHEERSWESAWDDVTEKFLKFELGKKSRAEEIANFRKMRAGHEENLCAGFLKSLCRFGMTRLAIEEINRACANNHEHVVPQGANRTRQAQACPPGL